MRRRDLPVLLETHTRALAACRRCGLGDAVRPIVNATRDPRAMLVGQAPGKVELAGGNAFSGGAGKTLFRWLERAGLDEPTARDAIWFAAVSRCYPGPSLSGRGDRVPSPRERALCGSWLDDELRIIRPPLLIPVGRLALDRFFGPRPLDALIGRAHEVEHAGGRSLAIPLPHPSGASSWIHAPGHQALLVAALALLREELIALGIVARSRGRSVA
ncbi:MAG: uracil-DNA glycosylase [Gemmatimonadaceae bacterium]